MGEKKTGGENPAQRTTGLNKIEIRLNKPRRVGRGCSSGAGKTCGRGQKGQKSRAGSGIRSGFEGGQMPLQRRLPKFGFRSRKPEVFEVRLSALNKPEDDVINMKTLIEAGIIPSRSKYAKLIASGKVDRAVTIKGIAVTAGARRAVEAAGGRVE